MRFELFHTGYVVADLEAAMAELSAATGTSWRPVADAVDFGVRTAAGPRVLQGKRVYSLEGPPYLELIEVDGAVWGAGRPAGAMHVGYWVDDLAAAAEHLRGIGLTLAVSDAAPDGGFRSFAYFQSAAGPIIEILPRWRRDELLGPAEAGVDG